VSASGPNRRLLGYDYWKSPIWLVKTIDEVFNREIVDISARTEEESALPSHWPSIGDVWGKLSTLEGTNKIAYCNPPYGTALPKWTSFVLSNSSIPVLWLVPCSTDAKWFKNLWQHANLVIFFTGRLDFYRLGREGEKTTPTIGSALVATKFLPPTGDPLVKLVDKGDTESLRIYLKQLENVCRQSLK